ncbi:hypothetical protein IAU60_000696 [Kwoniella sp. DSM 27419]
MAQAADKSHYKTGGDDLDDGLELDADLLAPSDDEASVSDGEEGVLGDEAGSEVAEEDGDDVSLAPLEGEEDEIVKSPIAEGKKRKADDAVAEEEDPEAAKAAEKKRRKKEKEKERKARRAENAAGPSSSSVPTHYAQSDLSALLLRSIRESFPSASAVELEDKIIPQDHLLPPASYPIPSAEEGSFVPLQTRIAAILKPLEKKKLVNGQPKVIVLALSGLRCADVVRGVRDVKGNGEVAKLFAKHFKLADQIKYLEKTKVSIAVGTPARVGKLLAEGAIKITSDTVVLLDVSHQDSKTRTILTLPEVRDELWKSVFGGEARVTLLKGGARVGAF